VKLLLLLLVVVAVAIVVLLFYEAAQQFVALTSLYNITELERGNKPPSQREHYKLP